ncbi:MAG TPA: hypothetical protein EYQ24_03385 [Bacteroidetes bacterium]|nr:hypothetical protein [Bacteroidota bacterium]HIL56640.1 hypothetical protein [Rhodothermales bacterium]
MSKRTRVLLALCLGAVSVGAGYGITAAVAGGPQHDAAPVPETSAANAADHGHAVRNVADSTLAPALTHRVAPDSVDGYNVQILAEPFRFTPAAINDPVEENAGHAHVYVNGAKVMRVYSDWVHLPSRLLQTGANYVTVTLNANDHSTWGVGGVPITSTVRVDTPAPREK